MKILAIEQEIAPLPTGQKEAVLKEEASKVWEFTKLEIIREVYFTADHRAVLVLECNSSLEAAEILNQLPLVKLKLIAFEILELKPYTGFERLFGRNV